MASVAGSIAVTLALNSRQYRAGFKTASLDVKAHGVAAKNAGIGVGSLRRVMNELTKANFASLTPRARLNENLKAANFLYKQGAINASQLAQVTTTLNAGFRRANSTLLAFINRLGVFKTVALGIAGARVFGAITQQFSEAFELSREIQRASAVLGDNTGDRIRSAARAAGSNTTFSANAVEAAKAIQLLGRDGLETGEAIERLNSVLTFSEAANLDVVTAVEKSSDAFTAWRLNVGTAADSAAEWVRFLDIIAGASLEADVQAEQLLDTLTRSAPLLANLNTDPVEVIALSVEFAKIGIKGERAGEEINRIFRDFTRVLNDPDEKVFLKAAGLDLFGDDGRFVGTTDALDQFQELVNNAAGTSDEARLEFIRALGFQDKAQRAILSALAVPRGEIQKTADGFDELEFRATKLAKANLTGIERLGKSIANLSSSFLEGVVVKGINETIVAFESLGVGGGILIKGITTLASSFVGLVVSLKAFRLVSSFLNLSDFGAVPLARNLRLATRALSGFARGSLTAASSFRVFKAAVGGVPGILALIVSGVIAAGGAYLTMSNNVNAAKRAIEDFNDTGIAQASIDKLVKAQELLNPAKVPRARNIGRVQNELFALAQSGDFTGNNPLANFGFGGPTEREIRRLAKEMNALEIATGRVLDIDLKIGRNRTLAIDLLRRTINAEVELTKQRAKLAQERELLEQFPGARTAQGNIDRDRLDAIRAARELISTTKVDRLFERSLTDGEKLSARVDELLAQFSAIDLINTSAGEVAFNLPLENRLRLLEQLETQQKKLATGALNPSGRLQNSIEDFKVQFGIDLDTQNSPVLEAAKKQLEAQMEANRLKAESNSRDATWFELFKDEYDRRQATDGQPLLLRTN